MVQPLIATAAKLAASRVVTQIARIAPIGAQKRLPLLAAFSIAILRRFPPDLVSHDRLFAFDGSGLRSHLGRRGDQGVEGDETFFWLLAQNMLAIKPRHLRVFGILLG